MTSEERKIIKTADGSQTIYLPHLDEHYHSTFGARTESEHVFVKHGFAKRLQAPHRATLRLLEVGFGTGLNALLTWLYLQKQAQDVTLIYRTYELYPLSSEMIADYCQGLSEEVYQMAMALHEAPWGREVAITPQFTLHKICTDLTTTQLLLSNDVIYMDAFGPDKTPELWTLPFLQKLFDATAPGGILSTYSAKGAVRRSLEACGYDVTRTPGPAGGKREILVAHKP